MRIADRLALDVPNGALAAAKADTSISSGGPLGTVINGVGEPVACAGPCFAGALDEYIDQKFTITAFAPTAARVE
jgi:hypothetical protein